MKNLTVGRHDHVHCLRLQIRSEKQKYSFPTFLFHIILCGLHLFLLSRLHSDGKKNKQQVNNLKLDIRFRLNFGLLQLMFRQVGIYHSQICSAFFLPPRIGDILFSINKNCLCAFNKSLFYCFFFIIFNLIVYSEKFLGFVWLWYYSRTP